MNRLPDPRREVDDFNAWSLMYLERELSPAEELAFQDLLARSPEAATAFARVAEMDTALFENAGAEVLMPADAEALDPRNADHMQFVTEVCREMQIVQRVPAHPSTTVDEETAGNRWWVPALAAAGILIGVAIYLTAVGSQTNPMLSNGQEVKPPPVSPVAQFEQTPVESESKADEIVVIRRRPSDSEATAPSVTHVPAPRVVPWQPDLPKPATQPEVAVKPPAPTIQNPERELVAKAVPQHELGSDNDPRIFASAMPVDIDLTTDIWRTTGDLPVERQALSAGISLKSDDKDVWRRGGLIYLVPYSLALGRPSLKIEVTGPIFSSALHDFEFIVTNKPHGGTLITLSVKRENLGEIEKTIDLKKATHAFELFVWRFNRYEIRVDGHTFYFHCESLNQPEWDNLYLGFRGLSRDIAPAAAKLLVKDVNIGYVGKGPKK